MTSAHPGTNPLANAQSATTDPSLLMESALPTKTSSLALLPTIFSARPGAKIPALSALTELTSTRRAFAPQSVPNATHSTSPQENASPASPDMTLLREAAFSHLLRLLPLPT